MLNGLLAILLTKSVRYLVVSCSTKPMLSMRVFFPWKNIIDCVMTNLYHSGIYYFHFSFGRRRNYLLVIFD